MHIGTYTQCFRNTMFWKYSALNAAVVVVFFKKKIYYHICVYFRSNGCCKCSLPKNFSFQPITIAASTRKFFIISNSVSNIIFGVFHTGNAYV